MQMKMKDQHQTIDILGCGKSINEYDLADWTVRIGVNDVRRHVPTLDYLIVINNKSQFTPERQQFIHRHSGNPTVVCVTIPSLVNELRNTFPIIKSFKSEPQKGSRTIDQYFAHSSTSPFFAAVFAIKNIPNKSRLRFFGVDLVNHHAYGKHNGKRHTDELARWKWLFTQAKAKGYTIEIPKYSVLNNLI